MVPCRLPGSQFRLWEFLWALVTFFWRFSYDVLDTLSLLQSFFSSAGFLELSLKFVCGSLHLFPPVTGHKFFDNNWDSYQSDCRRWSVQATYALLLGVLAEVILVGLWEFPLHRVSIWPWNIPPFLIISFSTLLLYLLPSKIPQVPILQFTQEISSLFSFQRHPRVPPWSCLIT